MTTGRVADEVRQTTTGRVADGDRDDHRKSGGRGQAGGKRPREERDAT